MKKSILNLGKSLNKAEQRTINGGKKYCKTVSDCPENNCCVFNACLQASHPFCFGIQ